jgi:hypothetical protein
MSTRNASGVAGSGVRSRGRSLVGLPWGLTVIISVPVPPMSIVKVPASAHASPTTCDDARPRPL